MASSKIQKRLQDVKKAIEPLKEYQLDEAIDLMVTGATAKFDETVDIVVNLGVDPRHSDQMVRGLTSLPHGVGKEIRVAVFAKGENADKASEAGADIVGGDDLVENIKKGKIDFERCIATPDMMAKVGSVGKILGPRGLMPNPKLGTVTKDVAAAVKAAKSGQVEFRVEKQGIIHAGVGKVSFEKNAIKQNILAFVDALNHAKPSGAKGVYLKSISLSSTMGPGIAVSVPDVAQQLQAAA